MSVLSGAKKAKRKAPLPPEEVHPNLARGISTNVQNGSRMEYTRPSTERQPRTLPLDEPDPSSTSRPYSSTADSDICRSSLKGPTDINFPSDNEALDVRGSSEDVKAFINASRNGKKRHSSGDLLQSFDTSQSSLQPLNSSKRSFSLNSISSAFSTEYAESQMVDQQDIITLTVHVRDFSVALSKLRNAFSESGSDTDSDELTDNGNVDEDMHVKAHEHLGKVLLNLKEVINEYPALQSNEILEAAGHLISKIKGHNYEENRIPDEFYKSIDQLALVFSSSISDFLMGDQEPSPKAVDDADDCVDEFAEYGDEEYLSEGDPLQDSLPSIREPLNVMCVSNHNLPVARVENDIELADVEVDLTKVLLGMQSGVDFCLQWTKCWSKYVKDIANYIEKRAQLEADFTKQLAKLVQTTRTSICEENYLPFQSTFFTALEQDLEYSQQCQRTLTAITGPKFMEPLMQRRSVHDRARKDMKDEWTKMCKQLHESESSVKTSQNIYHKRKQELEKLNTRQNDVKDSKEDSSSVISVFATSKGKKEEELKSKVSEAKQFYKNAIAVANNTQTSAEKTKERIVTQTKQLVNECDRTFRSVTRKYFDMMHDLAVPTPIHFKLLAETCQSYEPGKEFEEFVRFQQSSARLATHPIYEFEQYIKPRALHLGLLTTEVDSSGKLTSPKALASQFGYLEYGTSPAASPSSSPQSAKKPSNRPSQPPPSTDDESDGEQEPTIKPGRKQKRRPKSRPHLSKVSLSPNASTHTFHRIRSSAKCSECDSYVFNGVECVQCGLSCHKKCLENLYTACSHSRDRPSPLKRMKIFGVHFSEDGGVPVLVAKCVNEINKRGLQVKGIYRVSGVKSKMEGLCQEFETNADLVDVSTCPPHLLASVLKLYIRQLPEPLMTTKLYSELIQLAKESSNVQWLTYEEYDNDKDKNDFKKLLERLKEILNKLPKSNYLTAATLIKHLHKVASNEQYNKMSSQNLAIVFGPTILRLKSENSVTSLSSLVDMPHQTRIVALLIVNPQLFGDAGDDPEVDRVYLESGNDEATLVEEFVSPKTEEETTMPDLYGRSTRVRGEGLSPMDQLQSSDVQENERVDRNTSRINGRIDVEDERAQIFDVNEISLPGRLETKNESPDWVPDDDDLSEREADIGQSPSNSDKQPEMNQTGDSTKDGNSPKSVDGSLCDDDTSILPRNESVVKENLDDSKSSVDSAEMRREGSDETLSSSVPQVEEDVTLPRRRSKAFSAGKRTDPESDETLSSSVPQDEEDVILPRRRSKAFSAGKRTHPEMLAKRGSALMNAFIDSNVKMEEPKTSGNSPTRRTTDGGVHVTTDDVTSDARHSDHGGETAEVVVNGDKTRSLSSTVTSATVVKSETTGPESKTTTTRTKEGSEMPQNRSATSYGTGSLESSADELSDVKVLTRQRSATFDGDSRQDLENRPEKENTHNVGDRLHGFGIRSRRKRVSVKDQVKQLEQRENKSDSSRTTFLSANVRNHASADNHSSEESAHSNGKTMTSSEKVDVKNSSCDDNGDEKMAGDVRAHEPLSRIRIPGPRLVPLETKGAMLIPRSPVCSRSDEEATFRALKMDISLESPRTPSSDSSDEESTFTNATVGRGPRLNTWSGRGLTPRDSNQAPEFV